MKPYAIKIEGVEGFNYVTANSFKEAKDIISRFSLIPQGHDGEECIAARSITIIKKPIREGIYVNSKNGPPKKRVEKLKGDWVTDSECLHKVCEKIDEIIDKMRGC